jgi:two-component system, chemotaxis family, chemotaxis protein CheY
LLQGNLRKSVIVIDDDKDTAEIFSEYLSMHGFDILGIGHNGKSALELYEKLRPEIVFLDSMMPEYDGLYGLEMIKSLDPDAKIIMVTADVSDISRRKMLALGAASIIYKPFELGQIIRAINGLSGVHTG